MIDVECDKVALDCAAGEQGVVIGFPRGVLHLPRVVCFVSTPPTPPDANAQSWAALHAEAVARYLPGGVRLLGAYDFTNSSMFDKKSRTGDTQRTDFDTPSKRLDHAVCLAKKILHASTVAGSSSSELSQCFVLSQDHNRNVVAHAVSRVTVGSSETSRAKLRVVSDSNEQILVLTASIPLSIPALFGKCHPMMSEPGHAHDEDSLLQSACFDSACCLVRQLKLQFADNEFAVSENDVRELATLTTDIEIHDRMMHAQVFMPVSCVTATKAGNAVCSRSMGMLSGSIAVCVVLRSNATVGEALKAARDDAHSSLLYRAKLLEEVDAAVSGDDISSCSLPSKIIALPKDSSKIPFTDYILEDENVDDDSTPRMAEIFSWSDDEIAQYDFRLLEFHVSEYKKKRPLDRCLCPANLTLREKAVQGSASSRNGLAYGLVVAVLALVLAVCWQLLGGDSAHGGE